MRNPWLCMTIVVSIALMGLVAVVATAVLTVYGREAPQILGYVIAGAIGALSSFLVSPPRGSVGSGQSAAEAVAAETAPWHVVVQRLEAFDRHQKANEVHLQHLREEMARVQGQTAAAAVPVAAPAPVK